MDTLGTITLTDILGIITLLGAGFTLFYTVTKHIANGLIFLAPIQDDNARLRDDLTSIKTKDYNALSITIIAICLSIFISVILNKFLPSCFLAGLGSVRVALFMFLFLLLFILYVFYIFKKKNEKVLSVEIKSGDTNKIWFLAGRISDTEYIFKDSNSKNYNHLKLLSKNQVINC